MHATIRLYIAYLEGSKDVRKTMHFFGHRDCPASIRPKLQETLVRLIEQEGVTVFYVGHQGDFDYMVQSLLGELAVQYDHISYAIVLSGFPGKNIGSSQKTLLPEGIETVPRRFAIVWRNRWMLERAQYVVTYVTHNWGGAARFAAEAHRQGKIVYNLAGWG